MKKFDQKLKKVKKSFKIHFFHFYQKVAFSTCFSKKSKFLVIFATPGSTFFSKKL